MDTREVIVVTDSTCQHAIKVRAQLYSVIVLSLDICLEVRCLKVIFGKLCFVSKFWLIRFSLLILYKQHISTIIVVTE